MTLEIVIGLVVLVVVGLPIILLALRNTREAKRREGARYAALPEEEKRREAATKRWGSQDRGSPEYSNDFNSGLW